MSGRHLSPIEVEHNAHFLQRRASQSALVDARSANSPQLCWPKRCNAGMARRPLRVSEGAAHSAFELAFGALRHLRTLMTLRLSESLAWRGNFLLPARHLSFGLVTRRGLSGRWHFHLLNVSNGHDTKHRPRIAANQASSLLRRELLGIGANSS
jgi:hypothetical protein